MRGLKSKLSLMAIASLLLGYTPASLADLEDVIRAQEQARKSSIESFSRLTGDKNVGGKGTRPDGSTFTNKEKDRFDPNGGGLISFKMELTDHNLPFDVNEEVKKDPSDPSKTKVRKLYGFTSSHGKLQDSSKLERTMYQGHEKFIEDEEANKSQEEGVELKGAFKVTTKEVQKKQGKAGSGSANGGGLQDEDDTISVARWEIRDEVRPDIEKVGEDSATSIINKSKDQDAENDNSKLANAGKALEAASRNLKMWAASALRSLSIRRVNRAVRDGALDERIKLDITKPRCTDWSAQARAEIPKLVEQGRDPEKLEEEIKRMEGQCQQVLAKRPDAIMPRFEKNDQGKDELRDLGVNKEDARERDERIQRGVITQFGKNPNEFENNWGYSQNDGKSLITTAFDENGNPSKQVRMSPAEQLALANQERANAKRDTEAFNERMPEQNRLATDQLVPYQKGRNKAWEITKMPDQVKEDFFITSPGPVEQKEINKYGDLLN